MATAYNINDIAMTDTGGLVVSPGGDLSLASIDQTQKQDAIIRLYTEFGDFAAIQTIGSLIIDFIGEPNTASNAKDLQNEILRALTADGRFNVSDIQIKIIPIAIDTLYVYITIQNAASTTNTTLLFNFSYTTGLQIQYLNTSPIIVSGNPNYPLHQH